MMGKSNSSASIGENRFLLIFLTLGHLVNDGVAGTIWIIAPVIAASLGLGPSEVGIILAVNGIAAGIAYVPAGVISDRISGQGWLMMLTFWWVAIGYFVATLVPGFWPITLLLAFGVMGDAFWHPVATGALVKAMPERRAQVLGIHAMGGSLGAEILGPIGTGLLLGFFSWQTSLQILVIPAVIMGLIFIPVSKRIVIAPKSKLSWSDFKSLLQHWATPSGVGMVVVMISYNMALFGMLAMTPLTLLQRYDFTPFMGSVIFAGMLVFGTLCQPYIGKISDLMGRKKLIVGTILVAAIAALFAGLVDQFLFFLIWLVISASLLTAIRPVILAAAVEHSGKSESTTLGLIFAVLDGMGALGALLAGFAGEIDLSFAFVLAAGLALLSVVAAVVVKFPEQQS